MESRRGFKLKASRILIVPTLVAISVVGSALGQLAHTVDRVLAAEGDFAAETKDGVQPLSHWKLWHLDDGGYQVVDVSLENASSVQIFQFDALLMPTGFTKSIDGNSQEQTPPTSHSMSISCQYKTMELDCTGGSLEGHKSTTSIAAEPPYVFMGEFYDLDFAWFMTGVINLASRGRAKNGIVNVYFLTDGDKPDGIGLENDGPIEITLLGEKVVQSDGRPQVLKEFEWKGQDDFPIICTNPKTMVITISNRENPATGFSIINYKEYTSWGPTR